MSMMLQREKHVGFREIGHFYYRRVRRILPSYLLVILLSLVASSCFLLRYLQVENLNSAVDAVIFTTNIKAADSTRNYLKMVTKASDLFTHAWSIALEMQFYLIFPPIFIIYKSIRGFKADLFLITIGSISIFLHVYLPEEQAFNMVHARLWQFILESASKHFNRNIHRIHLIATVIINFFSFPFLSRLMNRIVCTFLTAGLIFFHPTGYTSILSWKCFTYVGKLSYSLYLIHWPIYIIVKMQLPNSTMSLHIGVLISVTASMLLTETFEKFYLRADTKTIFYLILFLYTIIAAFYMNEMPKKLLINGTQRIDEMFTPVCTLKDLNSHEICDIPFNRMNLSTEEIIRINDFNCANDMTQLFYGKCSYRSRSAPWGWCDLSPENRTSVHKILVIGNSYAANQGRIVHEMCANSKVEVKIFQQNACEVLRVTMENSHCRDSRRMFHEAVRQYKPNVLFILTRYLKWMELPTTTSNETVAMIVNTAAAILRDLSQVVTDRIFVLHAIPRQKFNFHLNPSDVLGVGKVLDQMSFISQSLNLELARSIVERAVASCRKCRVIDYTQVFTVNNTYQTFDERTLLAYVNCQIHFTPYGLHRLRPFFKRICDNISYSGII